MLKFHRAHTQLEFTPSIQAICSIPVFSLCHMPTKQHKYTSAIVSCKMLVKLAQGEDISQVKYVRDEKK